MMAAFAAGPAAAIATALTPPPPRPPLYYTQHLFDAAVVAQPLLCFHDQPACTCHRVTDRTYLSKCKEDLDRALR